MRVGIVLVFFVAVLPGCVDDSSHWYSICNRAPGAIDVESVLVKVKPIVDEDVWTEWRENISLEANESRDPHLLALRGNNYELRVTVTPRDDATQRHASATIAKGTNDGLRLIVGSGTTEAPPGLESDPYQTFLVVEVSSERPASPCG